MTKFNKLNNKSFIIAEVGQNHQGDINIAKRYIETFSALGADAIKFQTRDNKTLFSEKAFNKEYTGENAFAKKYGLHRERLELKYNQLITLKKYCRKYKVKFMFRSKSNRLLFYFF